MAKEKPKRDVWIELVQIVEGQRSPVWAVVYLSRDKHTRRWSAQFDANHSSEQYVIDWVKQQLNLNLIEKP
jgi:hypothetical protein